MSTIYKGLARPCMEYASHVWGGGISTALLDRMGSKAFRLIGSPLTICLLPLKSRCTVTSLLIFYCYFHAYSSSELLTACLPISTCVIFSFISSLCYLCNLLFLSFLTFISTCNPLFLLLPTLLLLSSPLSSFLLLILPFFQVTFICLSLLPHPFFVLNHFICMYFSCGSSLVNGKLLQITPRKVKKTERRRENNEDVLWVKIILLEKTQRTASDKWVKTIKISHNTHKEAAWRH